jgi:hypothetical protein
MMTEEFPYRYSCSLSPILRIAAGVVGEAGIANLRKQVEGVVTDIEANRPVAASLRVPVPGMKTTRQIDLRLGPPGGGGEIVMKTFIAWDHQRDFWIVFVEGPQEDHWEKFFDGNRDTGSEVPGRDGPGSESVL